MNQLMNKRLVCATAVLLAIGFLLSGCAATTPHWDKQFGKTAHAAAASQVIDPAAVRNRNPVNGLDGAAARAAHAAYVASFAAPGRSDAGMMNGGAK